MKKNIAILLPYKEKYNLDKAGAASIWVKDYLSLSKLKNQTLIFGNLDKKDKPLTKNFVNIDLTKTYIKIGRAHVRTPVTSLSRMPSSA